MTARTRGATLAAVLGALMLAGCSLLPSEGDDMSDYEDQKSAWHDAVMALDDMAEAEVTGPIGASGSTTVVAVYGASSTVDSGDVAALIDAIAGATSAPFAEDTLTVRPTLEAPESDLGVEPLELAGLVPDPEYLDGKTSIVMRGDGSHL